MHRKKMLPAKAYNKWWDGYDASICKVVNIEDYPKDGKALIQLMKLWGDRYPFLGEIKGGTIVINPGSFFFIITSNHSIEEAFEGSREEDINAIKRRFHEVEIVGPNDLFFQTVLDFTILEN